MLITMSSLVWLELDAQAPDHNLRELSRGAREETLLCAVVKANAYGHGVAEMVKLLPSADWFAVNSLEEGLELRAMKVKKPILLLGHVPLKRLHEAVAADLRLTLYNRESLEVLAKLYPKGRRQTPGSRPADLGGASARVHLKIETGTGRQGIMIEDLESFLQQLLDIKGLVFEGISTHFANIEDTLNHKFAEKQINRFQQALDIVKRLEVKNLVVHMACTAAGILFPKTHFHMLRAGIGIYGLWPSRETYLSALMGHSRVPDLRPVLSWKTKIVQIKTLPEGHYVGYGCTYRTTRTTKLAVLPVGYADGYDRALGNTAYVLVHGKRASVIGRVCMNLTMIDVTDIPQVKLEDDVVLLGRDVDETISAELMASWAGTINYEIVSRISPLLQRRVK